MLLVLLFLQNEWKWYKRRHFPIDLLVCSKNETLKSRLEAIYFDCVRQMMVYRYVVNLFNPWLMMRMKKRIRLAKVHQSLWKTKNYKKIETIVRFTWLSNESKPITIRRKMFAIKGRISRPEQLKGWTLIKWNLISLCSPTRNSKSETRNVKGLICNKMLKNQWTCRLFFFAN